MTVSEYAKKMNSTVEIILKLCENLGISVNQPNDILEENDLVLLDDYFQDLSGLNNNSSDVTFKEPMSAVASGNDDISIDLDTFCQCLETFKPINEKLNSLNVFLSTIEHADLETAHLIDGAKTKINSHIEEIENIDKKINNIKTVLEESNPELAILFAYLSGEYLDEDGLFDEERIADDIEANDLSDTFSISELAAAYNNEYKQRALYAEIFSSEKGNKYIGKDGLIDINKVRKALKEKGLEDDQQILDIVSGANTYATQYMNGKFNDKNGVPDIEKMKKYLEENQITDIYGITELAGKSVKYDEMQKNQFTMLEQIDETLAEYKEKLSEIDEEMKERDSVGYKLVDAILPNFHQGKTLEELQKEYDDLYTAMAAIKTEKDVLMDSAYFMYVTKGNFEKLSKFESDIAYWERNADSGKMAYYDIDGNELKDLSDIEISMYNASSLKDRQHNPFPFSEYVNTYLYLTEDEKKVANYLLNTRDMEKLEEYFQFKENHANARKGQEEAEKVLEQIDRYYSNGAAWAVNVPAEDRNQKFYAYNRDTNLANGAIGQVEDKAAREKHADSAAYQATLGLLAKEGFFDGIVNFTDGVVNLFDADGAVSSKQYKTSYIMQGLNERYGEKQVENLVTTGVYEISSSIGNMTIPSVIGLVTRCPQLGTALMGLSAAGNAREEGLQSGMTGAQAWTYGILSGASESTMEYFLGGIPGLSKLDDVPGIKGYFTKMLSEGIEESAQTMLEPFLEAAATGRYVSVKSIDFKEVAKSGIYGMITAGLMNGGNLAINGVMYQINSVSSTNITSILNKYEGMDLTNEETISALTTDLLESGASVSDSGNVLSLPAGTYEGTNNLLTGDVDVIGNVLNTETNIKKMSKEQFLSTDLTVSSPYDADATARVIPVSKILDIIKNDKSYTAFVSDYTNSFDSSISQAEYAQAVKQFYDAVQANQYDFGLTQENIERINFIVSNYPFEMGRIDIDDTFDNYADDHYTELLQRSIDKIDSLAGSNVGIKQLYNYLKDGPSGDISLLDETAGFRDSVLELDYNTLIRCYESLNKSQSEVRSIKKEIFTNVPANLDDFSMARYLYLELNKRVSYEYGYFSLQSGSQGQANYYNQDISFDNLQTNRVICKGWSQLYAELLIDAGIDPKRISINGGDRTGAHKWVEIDFDNYVLRADATDAFDHNFDLSAVKGGFSTKGFLLMDKKYAGKNIKQIVRLDDGNETSIYQYLKNNGSDILLRDVDTKLGYAIDGKYFNELVSEMADDFYSPEIVDKVFSDVSMDPIAAKCEFFTNMEIPSNMNAYDAYAFLSQVKHALFGRSGISDLELGIERYYRPGLTSSVPEGATVVVKRNSNNSFTCKFIDDVLGVRTLEFSSYSDYEAYIAKLGYYE